MMAIALNGSDRFIEGFGPMPEGIKHHPFNDENKLEKAITMVIAFSSLFSSLNG